MEMHFGPEPATCNSEHCGARVYALSVEGLAKGREMPPGPASNVENRSAGMTQGSSGDSEEALRFVSIVLPAVKPVVVPGQAGIERRNSRRVRSRHGTSATSLRPGGHTLQLVQSVRTRGWGAASAPALSARRWTWRVRPGHSPARDVDVAFARASGLLKARSSGAEPKPSSRLPSF